MRWPKEALTDLYPCGHPRTDENTYLATQPGYGKRSTRTIRRCKICTARRARESYERAKRARLETARAVRDGQRSFCARCVAGDCGMAHRRESPDARCFALVSSAADARGCLCGAAWALAWKGEIARSDARTKRASRGGAAIRCRA